MEVEEREREREYTEEGKSEVEVSKGGGVLPGELEYTEKSSMEESDGEETGRETGS